MPKKNEQSEWYFFKAGSHAGMKAGPLTWERLCSQADEGTLEPEDVVWDPGSGWRTADQVPGLFAAIALSGTGGAKLDAPPEEASTSGGGRSWIPWVAALIVLVIIGASLGGYYGCAGDDGGVIASDQTTTSAVTTTVPGVTQQSSTTVRSTSTTEAGLATGNGSLVHLGEEDNGHEVRLHVGDRVRIELAPKPSTTGVRSVEWTFMPIVVQETDSGCTTTGDVLDECWLELETLVAGPVSVRARYEYASGAVVTPWVCYLIVTEPEPETE